MVKDDVANKITCQGDKAHSDVAKINGEYLWSQLIKETKLFI